MNLVTLLFHFFVLVHVLRSFVRSVRFHSLSLSLSLRFSFRMCVFFLSQLKYWWFKRPPITLLIHTIFFAIFHFFLPAFVDATYPCNGANQAFEAYHFPFLQVITLVVAENESENPFIFHADSWKKSMRKRKREKENERKKKERKSKWAGKRRQC